MAPPTWALGFGDEVWWRRLAQPNQHAWTEADATYKLQALTLPLDASEPKALVLCQILIDWYGDCMNPFGDSRTWNAPEGGPPCQAKEHSR
jgi:hypothetical protein